MLLATTTAGDAEATAAVRAAAAAEAAAALDAVALAVSAATTVSPRGHSAKAATATATNPRPRAAGIQRRPFFGAVAGAAAAATASARSGAARRGAGAASRAAGGGGTMWVPSQSPSSDWAGSSGAALRLPMATVRSHCGACGASSTGRSGGKANPSSTSRKAATLCGRSFGRGASIQSMVRRKLSLQPAQAAVLSNEASSWTARAVAGAGGRLSSR